MHSCSPANMREREEGKQVNRSMQKQVGGDGEGGGVR